MESMEKVKSEKWKVESGMSLSAAGGLIETHCPQTIPSLRGTKCRGNPLSDSMPAGHKIIPNS